MPRSLNDLIARADELADSFEAYEPSETDEAEPPLMALRRLAYQRMLLERKLADAVAEARRAGASWAKVDEALGTTGEAARQRYGNRVER